MAKILGGKDQILTHPAVEPEAMIEDPSLRGVSLETPVAVDMAQTSNPKSNVYSGAPIDIENYNSINKWVRKHILKELEEEK